MAGMLQACLLVGLAAPLVSFIVLALASPSLLGAWFRRPSAGAANSAHSNRVSQGDPHGRPAGANSNWAGWLATAAIGLSCAASALAVFLWAGAEVGERANFTAAAQEGLFDWLKVGRVRIRIGILLDSLTLIVYLMVTICATCIHVFSIAYMRGDPRFRRFFAWLSLFCFSMLGLVLSSNLLITFVFWELVGACSYFLIGFWFEKRSASDAAIKAFVVNRVGDFGFLIGLGLCAAYLKTLSIDGASQLMTNGPISDAVGGTSSVAGLQASGVLGLSLATWMGLGLFCGAVGKSAQFPLHVWLPDAMEGPTPVSALIHAATMVAAGVYFIARIFPLLTPDAQYIIAVIGCITLALAALLAVVQTDIKRVLAYSTLSQLGYMVYGLGIGAWIGSMHHLLTHAFFKALLFLGAGQVIAACHHEQDLRKLGGLHKKLPRTTLAFAIAVLAISGAGIPWTPLGIGGFYSKDEILAVALTRATAPQQALQEPREAARESGHARAEHEPPAHASGAPDAGGSAVAAEHAATVPGLSWLLFAVPLLVAYITPFYMGRCFALAFLGSPRDAHAHEHARESSLMTWPLLALAGLTLVSGWFLFRPFVAGAAPWQTVEANRAVLIDGHSHAVHSAHQLLPLLVGGAWIVGLGAAIWLYRDGTARADRFLRIPPIASLHRVLMNRFYVDKFYDFALVGLTKRLAAAGRMFDQYVIDWLADTSARVTERLARFAGVVLDAKGVDAAAEGVAELAQRTGGALRGVQTGTLRHYVLIGMTGIAGLLLALLSGGDWSWAALLVAAAVAVVAAPWGAIRHRLLSLSGAQPPPGR